MFDTSTYRMSASGGRSSFSDYLALAKPELTGLSVLTAVGATYLAFPDGVKFGTLLTTLIGTAFTGAAAGVLNEWMERERDAQMHRTEERPLPAGRVKPNAALFFGAVCVIVGLTVLTLAGSVVAGALGALTLASYLALYTPMKRSTPFATVVGGLPGALPPLIGWAVVHNGLTREAWALFFILFFWQMPHFLALGWMYRKDYARAGYRLLVVIDEGGAVVARQALVYTLALVIAALMPTLVGLSGLIYFVGALVATSAFTVMAVQFWRERSNTNARKLFFASLLLLPALYVLMMVDRAA